MKRQYHSLTSSLIPAMPLSADILSTGATGETPQSLILEASKSSHPTAVTLMKGGRVDSTVRVEGDPVSIPRDEARADKRTSEEALEGKSKEKKLQHCDLLIDSLAADNSIASRSMVTHSVNTCVDANSKSTDKSTMSACESDSEDEIRFVPSWRRGSDEPPSSPPLNHTFIDLWRRNYHVD